MHTWILALTWAFIAFSLVLNVLTIRLVRRTQRRSRELNKKLMKDWG